MAQKIKNPVTSANANSEITCETYIARHFKKERPSKLLSTNHCQQKSREKMLSATKPTTMFQNQISKTKPSIKQQNIPSPRTDSDQNMLSTYIENFIEIPTSNTRHRSKSSVSSREPWGQLLKSSKDNLSLFSSFDPLRTLHFLAKELQFQLQAVLPDNINIQQIVSDIQYALKRVPPEVASTIHLQQTIDFLPKNKKSSSGDKLLHLRSKADKTSQTHLVENEKLQVVMAENTLKLEASCKHLENLCSKLKYEREHLENELKVEKDSVAFLKKQIDVLQSEKDELLYVKLKALEKEKFDFQKKIDGLVKNANKLEVDKTLLESQITELNQKQQQSTMATAEMKSHIKELQQSVSVSEKECTKLKHHLRLCSIEKEKYLAILELRDRQISEIRGEMNHLQEIINEQLMELHSNAVSSVPNNHEFEDMRIRKQKENIGDTISSVTTNDDERQYYKLNNQNSLKELQSGDTDVSSVLQESFTGRTNRYMQITIPEKEIDTNGKIDAQLDPRLTIKQFFNTLKFQAFTLANSNIVNS